MNAPADFLAKLEALDRALVLHGFPSTSPWWKAQIERFVRSGCRRWIIRAGRRSGKSSTLAGRLAVAWALWGEWSVPPGDVAVIAIVSVSKDEASSRLRTVAAVLKTLGVTFDQRGDEIELKGSRPVVFKTFACNTSAVVGFTSIMVLGDEVARWESRDTGANPAGEVIGSLSPTMATQPTAFMVLCSSPWSTDDYHAERFDEGDSEHQIVSFAATWDANPTITEAQTHGLEPDDRVWSREYAGQPGATVSAALDPADVAACFARNNVGYPGRGFIAIDASSLRGDAFAWIAGRETDAGELLVSEADAFEGEELRNVSMAQVVDCVVERAEAWGTQVIYGDQREQASLSAMIAERGKRLESFAWSESSKDAAFMTLRRLMRERRVVLPDHAGLRREMTSIKAHLLPSGRTRYATNGLDYASALLTLIHAVGAGLVLAASTDWAAILEVNGVTVRNDSEWRHVEFGTEELRTPVADQAQMSRFGVGGRGY